MSAQPYKKLGLLGKYGFLWATAFLFVMSITGHWIFAWRAYVRETEEHGQKIRVVEYADEVLRDTFENWQSEFLQLIWQVAGLSFLLYVGSSQSKEGDERLEAKIDWLMSQSEAGNARRRELDQAFART